MIKEVVNLKKNMDGYMGGFREGKHCNYFIISKQKKRQKGAFLLNNKDSALRPVRNDLIHWVKTGICPNPGALGYFEHR